MTSFTSFILGEKEAPKVNKEELEGDEGTEGAEGTEELISLDDELKEIISEMSDEEKEILLAHAYALVLVSGDASEDDKEEEEEVDADAGDAGDAGSVSEGSIKHLTSKQRTSGKLMRRKPKWKKRARLRYIKNKKCPAGTTWSSETRSCTHINIDLSRLQKMIAKMRIRA